MKQQKKNKNGIEYYYELFSSIKIVYSCHAFIRVKCWLESNTRKKYNEEGRFGECLLPQFFFIFSDTFLSKAMKFIFNVYTHIYIN